MDSKVIRWKIPDGFEELPEVINRNLYTENISKLDADEISRKCLSLHLHEVRELFSYVKRFLPNGLSGEGIDLGAGTGILSTMAIESFPGIDRIYGVEIVSGYPEKVMLKIAQELLGDDAFKLVPVIGSFDYIEMDDRSLDFALEIHSLHHSHDLNKTLKEVHRVLKPGGYLVCWDRSHPNSITNEQIENMLDRVYSEDFLEKNGYPKDIRLTRRENGEHEHRLRDWFYCFNQNGFTVERTHFLVKPVNHRSLIVNSLTFVPSLVKDILRITNKVKRSSFDKEFYKISRLIWGQASLFRRDYTMFMCKRK